MKLKTILMVLILLTGCWQLSGSSYMLAKAWFSQYLIASAWSQTLEDKQFHTPWSWADTYPIAQMKVPRLQAQSYILSGSSGRNLAFSATHMQYSGTPGEQKTTIISGHKDTHFSYLQYIAIGDDILLKTMDNQYQYKVINIKVVDSKLYHLNINSTEELLLTTCYPFDSISLSGTLRYVVHAIPVT